MAKIFKKFLFSKDETPFVMELPPYRIPTFKSLMRDTWDKGKQYLHKIGTIILAGSIIIWGLSYFPTDSIYKDPYIVSSSLIKIPITKKEYMSIIML
jgi:ferrous iron transport protein B